MANNPAPVMTICQVCHCAVRKDRLKRHLNRVHREPAPSAPTTEKPTVPRGTRTIATNTGVSHCDRCNKRGILHLWRDKTTNGYRVIGYRCKPGYLQSFRPRSGRPKVKRDVLDVALRGGAFESNRRKHGFYPRRSTPRITVHGKQTTRRVLRSSHDDSR